MTPKEFYGTVLVVFYGLMTVGIITDSKQDWLFITLAVLMPLLFSFGLLLEWLEQNRPSITYKSRHRRR
jgi:hypothetical protein